MNNKALAFDYVTETLFRNIEADKLMMNDQQLSDTDKQELLNVLNPIKTLAQIQNPVFKLHQENIKNSYETMISLKKSIQDVIQDAKKAYTYVSWMYVVAFYLGVALIVTAIVFAALDKTILSIAFGTIGLADIVGHFIFKPPLELQTSRANLAQLMVILTNWFADISNLHSFIQQTNQPITMELFEKISDKQNENTKKMIDLIERYCEPAEKPA